MVGARRVRGEDLERPHVRVAVEDDALGRDVLLVAVGGQVCRRRVAVDVRVCECMRRKWENGERGTDQQKETVSGLTVRTLMPQTLAGVRPSAVGAVARTSPPAITVSAVPSCLLVMVYTPLVTDILFCVWEGVLSGE